MTFCTLDVYFLVCGYFCFSLGELDLQEVRAIFPHLGDEEVRKLFTVNPLICVCVNVRAVCVCVCVLCAFLIVPTMSLTTRLLTETQSYEPICVKYSAGVFAHAEHMSLL